MTETAIRKLLGEFKAGTASPDDVLQQLKAAPYEDLGFALVDHHREIRSGFPEVIFGEGKTPEQVAGITEALIAKSNQVLITRANDSHYLAVKAKHDNAQQHPTARCITVEQEPLPKRSGEILIICAGTSDLPVAEEALVTANIMGNQARLLSDVGVAGLHRLLSHTKSIQEAHVIIAVAGMEGALPSVVAGLTSKPVIAVPTSVGYGTNLGGIAALLGMLNSCGSGVTVVNIDNGFGAGYAASQINQLAQPPIFPTQ
ncbi:nickel pincer cofactor biosynthesis protein LarB [Verrucomicrobia bacterium]|nr:nickel pincer cofactor biosynthesis protein LarB [Verrucomicrobiota bacterium]